MAFLEAGGTVISARDFYQIALLVVIIDTAEEAHDGVLVLAAGHLHDGGAGIVRAHQVKVVQGFGQEVLAHGAHALGRPVLHVHTGRGRNVVAAEGVFIRAEHIGRVALIGSGILREGILAGAGGIVLVGSVRITAELEVHAAVLVAVLIQPVGIVGREGELFHRRNLELGGVGEVAAVLLVAGLSLTKHQMAAVGHVVAYQRSSVQPASVRVLEREGSQGVTGGVGEGILHAASAGIVVSGAVEGRVVGNAGVLVDAGVNLGPQVELLEHVRIHLDNTALAVIGAGQVVFHILVAAGDGDVLLNHRVLVVVKLMVPVRIGIVNPLLAAVAHLFHHPGTGGILRLVVHTGQQFGHVVGGVVGVVLAGIGSPELVHRINRPVTAGFKVRRDRGLFPAPAAGIAHLGLSALVRSSLGGHQNHAVGGTGAVDGGGRCILNHGDVLHVGGVHAGKVSLGAVDEHQRIGRVDGGDTADVQGTGAAGITGRGGNVKAGNRTLKHVGEVVRGTVGQFLGVHGGHGTGEVHLLLDTVTHHHRLFQHHLVLLKDHIHAALGSGDIHLCGHITQAGYLKGNLGIGHTDGESTVGPGHVGIVGAGDHDNGAHHRRAARILDDAGDNPVLGTQGPEGSQRQNQGNSNSFNLSHRLIIGLVFVSVCRKVLGTGHGLRIYVSEAVRHLDFQGGRGR